MFPYFFEQSIEIKFHVAADDNGIGLFSNHIDLFHRDSVDLVVAIEALNVLSVALDDINEVVNGAVIMHKDISIVNLVL